MVTGLRKYIYPLPSPKPVKEAQLFDWEALCLDIRLNDNPELERVVSNAADGGGAAGGGSDRG